MSYNKEQQLQEEIKQLLQEEQKVQGEKVVTPKVETETPTSEVVTETQAPEVYTPKDEWEEKALKIGWDPNKEGPNAVDAKEYVLRKPLFERIEKQSKELRDIKERQKKQEQYAAQIRREGYEQALRDLEARRDAAVSEANTEEFRRTDSQHKRLTQQMMTDPIVNVPSTPEINQEVLDFGNKNSSWYNTQNVENAKMKAAADSVDNYLTQAAHIEGRQINITEHLNAIETEVKKLFPHRFEQTKPAVVTPTYTPPVQMVGKSTTRIGSSTSSNLVNQLTRQQRELGERFHASNPEFTLEVYAKQLQDMGRLGK